MVGMVGGRLRSTALVVMLASTAACAAPAGARLLPTSTYVAHAPLPSGPRRCAASMIRGVVARANDARRRVHLASLVADESLTRAANARARSMAAEQRLSHDGWDSVVHGNTAAGENIAYNYASVDAVMRGWLASPGHRANILQPRFHRIGVGCVVDGRGKRWWTQTFAD